ncbi:uncharacterized protein LOC122853265 [Aphidius gifuensis]|uniref:uncharacterized protein LOC122853265 n=1 Tax=Aphidius gifuensis TaxID=684658 RepID=UPI001CDBC053|nr:uncharacterized protein LOC122853265 [Aphidius gifuensis]
MHPYSGRCFYKFPTEIDGVISELKALEKFEVAGIVWFFNLIHNHYCDDLYYSNHILKGINKLNDCTELNLSTHQITDNGLYIIANVMVQLKILCISCELVSDDGVVAISKINNLQTLELIGSNNVTDSSIKLLKNLTKLKLPCSAKITDDSVTKVLENSPDMEDLYAEYTSVTVEFIKKAADISKNRERVLHVGVTFIPDTKQYESQYFTVHIS